MHVFEMCADTSKCNTLLSILNIRDLAQQPLFTQVVSLPWYEVMNSINININDSSLVEFGMRSQGEVICGPINEYRC